MVTKVLIEALLQLVSREEEEVERQLNELLWAATLDWGSVGRGEVLRHDDMVPGLRSEPGFDNL
jgi:hypothetical protein